MFVCSNKYAFGSSSSWHIVWRRVWAQSTSVSATKFAGHALHRQRGITNSTPAHTERHKKTAHLHTQRGIMNSTLAHTERHDKEWACVTQREAQQQHTSSLVCYWCLCVTTLTLVFSVSQPTKSSATAGMFYSKSSAITAHLHTQRGTNNVTLAHTERHNNSGHVSHTE